MLLVLVGAIAPAAARDRSGRAQGENSAEFGPEMIAYLEFLDSEAAELRYYLDGHEMAEGDYRIAKDKLDVTREFAVRIVRKRGVDAVPDLYVVRGDELTQIVPAGLAALKGKRPGTQLDDVWIFHGTSRKSDLFYVLERTDAIRRAPAP
jgi:hypothetical protein